MPRIKHVVLMKIRADATQDQIDDLFDGLRGLYEKLPGVLDFSGGPNNSAEGFTRGFTHGFVMTFADAAAREVYLPDPDHEVVKAKAVGLLDGGLDGVMVLDWEEA